MRFSPTVVGSVVLASLGCTDVEGGLAPVGGVEVTEAEQARFVRRLHLDLEGAPPDEATTRAALEHLAARGTGPESRGELAAALLASEAFAAHWASELEGRVLAGVEADDLYARTCSNVRAGDSPCREACGPVRRGADPCDCEACDTIAQLAADRDATGAIADDLLAGAATGTLERRFAGSLVYRLDRASVAALVTALFEDFLGRPPEPEELAQATRIAGGGLGDVAGILFHRHGGSFDDLIDIVFGAEVYREAVVDAVFRRYLGRPARPAELVQFVEWVDPDSPDALPLIRAALASEEYFAQ